MSEWAANSSAENGNHVTGNQGNGNGSPGNMLARARVLWDRRKVLVRFTLVGMAIALVGALLIPKRYESTTRLMPPDSQSSNSLMMLAAISGKAGSLGGVAGDLLGFKSSGALFTGILRSRTVEERLVGAFDLQKVYGARRVADARQELEDNTRISEDRKSGIITITVSDREGQRAAGLAGAYVTELNRLVNELNTSSARREREFLEGRLAEVQGDLERAERDFSEFASKNTAINIEAQGKAMIDAAATLEGELIAAQTELQSLKQIYTDSNVRVRATQARVDELRRNIENLSGNADGGKAEGKGGETSAYPSIRKLPLLGVSYADLYRRMKVQESIFETLTQENELAKVEEAKETPSVKVIDAPDVPERKSFPPRLEIVASGSLLALAAGVLWVLARAEWDARDTSDAGKIFAQEIFETVEAKMPWAEPNGSRVQALAHRVWVKFARERENSSAKYRGLIVRK